MAAAAPTQPDNGCARPLWPRMPYGLCHVVGVRCVTACVLDSMAERLRQLEAENSRLKAFESKHEQSMNFPATATPTKVLTSH